MQNTCNPVLHINAIYLTMVINNFLRKLFKHLSVSSCHNFQFFSSLQVCFFVVFLSFAARDIFGQNAKQFTRKHFPDLPATKIKDTLIKLSEQYAETNPDSSKYFGEIAYEIALSEKEKKFQALALHRIAEALFYKDKYYEAIGYYLKSAQSELIGSNDSSSFYAERLTDAAYCFQELGIYDKALELNLTALRIQQKLGNKVEIGNNLCNIGTNYFFRSQYDKAIEYFSQNLAMDRLSGDSSAIAISLNNIGMVYSRWEKHDQALRFYSDALHYTTQESRKAIRLSNIGMAYFHLGKFEEALHYLRMALSLDLKYNQQVKIGIRKNEIATVLSAMGRYNEAINLMEEALAMFRETGVTDSQIILLADLGDVYLKTGQTIKAEKYFFESAELAKTAGALHHLARDYKSLYEIAEKKKNFQQAFKYLYSYKTIYDSIFNNEKHQQIARFQTLYETEKKEIENQILLRDIETKKRSQKASVFMIVALVLILLLVFNFLRIKSKNLKQSRLLLKQSEELATARLAITENEKKILEDRIFAEKQINRLENEKFLSNLNLKNAELASITLSLIHKNDILQSISEKLNRNHSPETLHELKGYVRSNLDYDQDWKKFRIDFEKVHPGFFDRLKEKYPYVTENDSRLAAYLRLNLSSKEISGLMNVSLLAVNKSRQRLRKKLGMPAEAEFPMFLSKI